MLINNTISAVKKYNLNKVVLAGGVSANSYIRNAFSNVAKENNLKLYYPELEFCMDNAAMIGAAAYYNFLERQFC